MTIQIVTVGNKPRPALSELVTTYTDRLPRNINVVWHYVKHGSGDSKTSMQQETEKILSKLSSDIYVVLLDENGSQITSEDFSDKFIASNKDIAFIIGGAYGVTKEVKNRANYTLSLSKLVLPHQLVRILLIEQIYRGYSISVGHPYHHA